MKAVILAGGEGKRLRPITDKRPKPLVPIAGKPCVDYVIQSLVNANFREILITTSYMSDTLIQGIGNGRQYGACILYSFEDKPLGTAGAVKNVEQFLSDTFIVASGDVLADVDIRSLYDYHKSKGGIATMALTTVDNPSEYGVVGLDSENKINRFKEKPKGDEVFSHLINAGIYILEPKIFEYIPHEGAFDFSKDAFPKLLEQDIPIFGRKIDGLWMDIGRPDDLLNANYEMSKRRGKGTLPDGRKLDGKVLTGTNTIIDKTASVKGHSFVGDHTRICENVTLFNAYVHKNSYVDKNCTIHDSLVMSGCTIGENCEIKHCIISDNCKIGEGAKMHNCLIGNDVKVKPSSTVSDVKITSGEIGG